MILSICAFRSSLEASWNIKGILASYRLGDGAAGEDMEETEGTGGKGVFLDFCNAFVVI